ncbi:MAG: (d)CMP kinase [Bacilli bacterium]|nr:(d)CMP kinase [Bacilli bacterium]
MDWQIAIDGPAGAGKSTIAKEVAKRLHFEYLDTGAMYRAVTLKAINLQIDMEQETQYQFLNNTTIDFSDNEVYLDGINVSDEIRSIAVTNNVSLVSKFKTVRSHLVKLQQKLVKEKNVIMDGRDIGTVVLPHAPVKIFLVASIEVRAKRRMVERLEENGICLSLEDTIKEIKERDYKDSNREISPLAKATDAIEIDTSNMSIEEVIDRIISLVMERGYKMEIIKNEQEVNAEKENVVEEVVTAKEEQRKVEEVVTAEEEQQKVEDVVATAEEQQEVEQVVTAEEEQQETEQPVEEEVSAKENEENESETDVPTTETETVELVKELQLVMGTVVKILPPEKEIKQNNKVVRKAKEERMLIRLENGQEGYLFRKDAFGLLTDEELADRYMEEDNLEVVVKKVYPDGGKVLLSTILVEKRKEIKKFEEVIKNHEYFSAKVVRIIKVGLILEYEGFPCLLPTSQITVGEEEYQGLLGQEMLVAPIRVDYNRIRLLVSNTVANAIKNRNEKQDFIKNIKVGDVFEGTVKNIESYGAFVEIAPGIEGLLHISEIGHNRVTVVTKVLNTGDTVKVQVIKVDKDHIGLSRKALLPNYWKEFVDATNVGDNVTGKVAEINRAGVVVAFNENVQGFLPRSEFSWERDTFIEDFIKVDEEIELKVIELDLNKKRIILSKKQLAENPWETLKFKAGDMVNAVVVKVEEAGIKVNVDGASGFLPKGSITPGTKFIQGESFEAKVRVFDPSRTRLILNLKEENVSFDRNQINKMLKNQEKVVSTFADFVDMDSFKGKNKKK